MNYEYELYHHGVKGMKWGVRKKRVEDTVRRNVRGHGGPGKYTGSTNRQISKYKKDLDVLNKGGHLSVGTTKKRQAEYDKRDRAALEKKISNLETKKNSKQFEFFFLYIFINLY